jgi:queuine tRNA-ribosyltransferase
MRFSISGKDGRARAGTIETPHGAIETPAFIPVGTKATVKAVPPEFVRDQVGAYAVLANTYHLYLQPGAELVKQAGGLGRFMNWKGPTFTDSGGFQAFSLAGGGSKFSGGSEGERSEADRETAVLMAKVDDDGVDFRSVLDGSSHRFTPESSIEIQHDIGADIIFVLDECAAIGSSRDKQAEAVARTTRWAERGLKRHRELGGEQVLFGIVQGGKFEDLRTKSAAEIGKMDFDGFGIGGTFEKTDMGAAVAWACAGLESVGAGDKPRHLLGIGEPEDLVLGIESGIDTFDCVAPTRMGRNGGAYTSRGRVNLTNAKYAREMGPIDPACGCHVCRSYSAAYIAHLFRAKEMLAGTLLSIHNLYFLVDLTKKARAAILRGEFQIFKKETLAKLS